MDEWLFSLIVCFFISCGFILIIDITKYIFKKRYENIDEEIYNIEEFKPIFVTTLIYLISLFLILIKIRSFLGFNILIYFLYDISLIQIIKASFLSLILNGVLFSGYIYQLIRKIEFLRIWNKNFFLIIKENIYGPLLEEIIYRLVIFNILKHVGGFSPLNSSIINSVMFGLCKNILNKLN
jgi:hypothetical protein